jgi:hypothetical protein
MTNTTPDLFTRHGAPVDPNARIQRTTTGRPFVVVVERCRRCGGAGGAQCWPGWTCYDCRGVGTAPPREVKLYTAEQLAKLDAAQTKRADARYVAHAAKAQAARAAFDAAHGELVAQVPAEWLDPALWASDPSDAAVARRQQLPRDAQLVFDIVSKGRHFGSLSVKQVELVRGVLARHAQRVAEQAQRAATSQHVGRTSERLTVDVVCVRHATYERLDRFRFHAGTETVHICQFEDAAGNVLVTKSPRFSVEQGARGTLTGTVKQHDVYRDVRQTVLLRATFAPAALAVDNQAEGAIHA